jgi:putative Mg2+ transporter-C (MgtC) family protein
MDSLDFTLRIVVALLLGVVIGLERQWRQHPAGLRTNALVAVGAAAFVSLTALMEEKDSKTRIASYIVSGLGFLGGGVIIRDGLTVKGMNTAATLWCTGAIGTLAGAGFRKEAGICTAVVLLVHVALRPLVRRIESYKRVATDVETYYRIRVGCDRSQEAIIRTILLRHIGGNNRMSIQSLSTEDTEKEGPQVVADVYSLERNDRFMEQIVARLSIEPNVSSIRWERTQG